MREFSEQGFPGSGSPQWRTYGSKNLGARRAPTDHARTPAGAAAARAHRLETGGRGTGQVWSATAGRGLQGRDAAQRLARHHRRSGGQGERKSVVEGKRGDLGGG